MKSMAALLTSFATLVLLVLVAGVAADNMVQPSRIKVFLFAMPAFYSEVAVDAPNNTCISLGNSLIDGKVQSLLVGGNNVSTVLQRKDYWYCMFYDNYACGGNENNMLLFPDGVNNLESVGWQTRIHSLQCSVDSD